MGFRIGSQGRRPVHPSYGESDENIRDVGTDQADAADKSTAEEPLPDSEKQFRLLVENMNDVVFSLDAEGRFTYVSPAIERIGLHDADRILGKLYTSFVYPEDLPGLKDSLHRTISGNLEPYEFRVISKDGSIRYVRTFSRPLIRDGIPIGLTGIMTDITDRKKIEEELHLAQVELEKRVQERTAKLLEMNEKLKKEIGERTRAEESSRESEDRWRRLVEHNPACLAVHRGGKLVYVNPAGLRLFQLRSREDVIGKPLLDFVHPDFRDTVVERVKEMMVTGKPAGPKEEKFMRPNGEAIDVEVTAIPINYFGERAIMTVTWDITERKRAEAALRSSEERYRKFFEMDLTADYISTSDGTLTVCNPAYVRMFGFSSIEEAMQTNVTELYPCPEDRDTFIQLLNEQQTLVGHEMELRHRDGSTLHIIANVTGLFDDDGDLCEIQGYLFDDTPRKLLEKQFLQAQKMEAVGRLAGGVAHDFNNMLGVILGMAELILNKMSAMDPLRRKIETIRDAANRSSDVARQLLAFASKQAIKPRDVDLNEVIETMHHILDRLVGETAHITVKSEKDLWLIRIDPSQIDQILANLATNARDALGNSGEIIIETANVTLDEEDCRSHFAAEPGDYVRLSFTDSGRGMAEDTKLQIFEPFFTTKSLGEGTGLGLSTVYGIVTQNNGFIDVHSTIGQGTTITIYFPRFMGEPIQYSTSKNILIPHGSGTILVVEDEKQLLELARISLEEHGYDVITASSPGDAILACEQYDGDIDLLLTDLIMPLMNGRDLKARIEQIKPAITTIYMSGYAPDTLSSLDPLEDSIPFIQKPFTPQSLVRSVQKILSA